jgi:hypothetical protein
MRLGVIIKMKPKSTAVRMDPSEVGRLIRQHRSR